MRGLGLPRKLLVKLVGSVVCAFSVTVAITWTVQSSLADRDAMKVINRALDDVQGEIEECVNRKLVLAAMKARDRLSEVSDRSSETLRVIADEMRVDDVCVVDVNGILVASADPAEVGLDFNQADGQAKEFLVYWTPNRSIASRSEGVRTTDRCGSTSACGCRRAGSCRSAAARVRCGSSRSRPSRGSRTTGTCRASARSSSRPNRG